MSESIALVATPYELIGREAGVLRLAKTFYDVLANEPAFAPLRAIHQPDLAPMRATLAAWMSVWMGRPRPAEPAPIPCIMSAHAGLRIDALQVRLWLACMRRAYVVAQIPATVVEMIDPPLVLICEGLRNDWGRDPPLALEDQLYWASPARRA